MNTSTPPLATGASIGVHIAGIDEAGRGALAGPVVAGACIITSELFKRHYPRPRWSPFQRKKDADCLIADSKQLSPEERDISYAWLVEHCFWGVGIVEADSIDRIGILAATFAAMKQALADLRSKAPIDSLLVDGRDHFFFDCPHRSIIKGDEKEPAIAGGSIIAKVTRDRLMCGYARDYSAYGFDQHKGYGSEDHIAAIRTHGPCALHRRTFLKNIMTAEIVPSEPLPDLFGASATGEHPAEEEGV